MKRIFVFLTCVCVLFCSCSNATGQTPKGSNSDSASANQQETMASTLPPEMDSAFPIEEWCDEDGVIDVESFLSDYGWNESYSYQTGINSETDGWYMVHPYNMDDIKRGFAYPQITLRCDGDNGSSFTINNVRGLGELNELNVEWKAKTKLEMMHTKNNDIVPKDLMRLLSVAMYWINSGTDETALVDYFAELADEAELEGIDMSFVKIGGLWISAEEAVLVAHGDASADSGEGAPASDGQERYKNIVGDAVLYTENSIDRWTESRGLLKGKTFNVGQLLVDIWQLGGFENNVGFSFYSKDGSARWLYFDDPDTNVSNLYHSVTVGTSNSDGVEFYTTVKMKDCSENHSFFYIINGQERSINEELARVVLVIAEEIERDPYRNNVLSGMDLGPNFEVH